MFKSAIPSTDTKSLQFLPQNGSYKMPEEKHMENTQIIQYLTNSSLPHYCSILYPQDEMQNK